MAEVKKLSEYRGFQDQLFQIDQHNDQSQCFIDSTQISPNSLGKESHLEYWMVKPLSPLAKRVQESRQKNPHWNYAEGWSFRSTLTGFV